MFKQLHSEDSIEYMHVTQSQIRVAYVVADVVLFCSILMTTRSEEFIKMYFTLLWETIVRVVLLIYYELIFPFEEKIMLHSGGIEIFLFL